LQANTTSNACVVSAALDAVIVADDCVAAATTLLAPMVLVGVGAFTVAGCVEFDLVSAGFDVVLGSVGSVVSPTGSLESCGVSTPLASPAGSALVGAGTADDPDSVALVCAPPLLLIVTPDATWAVEDVVLPVGVDPLLVDAAPVVGVDAVAVPAVDVPADPVDDSSDDVALAELVEDESDDVPVVSALATPGEVTTSTPTPRAAANAPTRPT
jgi:hypothetical protein